MKKLTLALIASTVALSATQANISSGFYAGGAVGYGGTTGKYATPDSGFPGAADVGAATGNIGIHGGYGEVINCLYVGGEIAATYDNSKINDTVLTGFNNPLGGGPFGSSQLKRSGYFNAALRTGLLVAPTTMLYLRLGANWSKWTFRDGGNLGNLFTTNFVGNGSRSRIAFVPGLGFETSLTKNLDLRLEYTYEFGPSIRAINTSVPMSSNIASIRSQSAKLGLSHKFKGDMAAQSMSTANIGSGFYGGGALGYGLTTAKYTVTLAPVNPVIPGSRDLGGSSGNIGIHGGYGFVYKCFYVGGEAGYTFDQSKINETTFTGVANPAVGGMQLKRSGYVNAALRGGYLVSAATMVYVRLGGNWSKWKFTDAGSPTNPFSSTAIGTGSNTRVSFVPGLGLETAVHKNIYVRGEYTYEFGPSIRATNMNTIGFTTLSNLRSQSAKLGVSYKF